MVTSAKQQLRWRMRPGFALILISVTVLLFVCSALVENSIGRGTAAESPDGTYRIEIWQKLDGDSPCTMTLFQTESNREIRRFAVELFGDTPRRPAEVFARAIQWSEDSTYADSVLNRQKVLRIFAPEM